MCAAVLVWLAGVQEAFILQCPFCDMLRLCCTARPVASVRCKPDKHTQQCCTHVLHAPFSMFMLCCLCRYAFTCRGLAVRMLGTAQRIVYSVCGVLLLASLCPCPGT
jgi:hypothetical protein